MATFSILTMIRKFEKEYRWLSNFYACELRFRGKRFESVEYAYMSAKSDDKAWKQMCIDAVEKPRKIKKLSQALELVPNWDTLAWYLYARKRVKQSKSSVRLKKIMFLNLFFKAFCVFFFNKTKIMREFFLLKKANQSEYWHFFIKYCF